MDPGSHVGFPISAKNINRVYDNPMNISAKFAGLDINVCPVPVKTDVGQEDLVLRCPTGQVKTLEIPKRAGTTDKSISNGIKYWVCCMKEPCLISNLFIIYFD